MNALEQVKRNLIKAVQGEFAKNGNPFEGFRSVNSKCIACGKIFTDINYIPELPNAKRLYCDNCVRVLWEKKDDK